jgi:polysaccharide pyruvyl transferase WcaK-like protein
MSRVRIGLYGLYGVRNLGNEATLAAALAALGTRLPEAEFVLVSSPPPTDAGLPALPNIEPDQLPLLHRKWPLLPYRWQGPVGAFLQRVTEPLRRWRTRRVARALDVLLVPGTGIADDFGQGHLETPHHLARWCRVVKEQGGRVAFLSVGAGPVSHPLARRWFGAALRAADYRSYREQSSWQFAREIGVDVSQDPVLPDMVFSLPVPAEFEARAVQWPPRSIGLGVMGYSGWNLTGAPAERTYARYLEKLQWVATQLLEAGYQVRLLIGNRGGDRRPVKDLRLALAGHPAAAALISAEILTHDDVIREIAATDVVIATRFHNVLKSLRMARPVISIGYARKNDDLMREFGLGDYCHQVEDFDPARVLEQLRTLANSPEAPILPLQQRVTEYRQALASQFEQIAAICRSGR